MYETNPMGQKLREQAMAMRQAADKLDEAADILDMNSLEFWSSNAGISASSGKPASAETITKTTEGGKDLANLTHEKAAAEVLKSAEKPLHKKEILQALVRGGHKISSISSLGPVLSKGKNFEKAGKGKWKYVETEPKGA